MAKQGTRWLAITMSAMALMALTSVSTGAADAIFAVFANPTSGAVAVKGAPADAAMAKGGALAIDSIAFGIENALVIDPKDGATGPGRPGFKPLSMTLPLGPGVPALLQTSGAGGHYGDVTIHFRTDGDKPSEYATLSLKVVAVSAVEVSARTDDTPQAMVQLTYGSMKLDYFAQDAKGQLAKQPESGQWNAMTGTTDYTTVPKP